MDAKEQQRDDLHRKLCEAAARGDFGDCQYLLDELDELNKPEPENAANATSDTDERISEAYRDASIACARDVLKAIESGTSLKDLAERLRCGIQQMEDPLGGLFVIGGDEPADDKCDDSRTMTHSNEGAVTMEQEQPSAKQSPMYGHWCGVIGSRGQMWFCCSLSHVNLNSERDDAVCKHGCGWLRPVRENNDTLLERVLSASKRVADAHSQCLATSASGPDSREWAIADLKRREACAELYRAVTAARNNEAL